MQIINYSGQRLNDVVNDSGKVIFTKINSPMSLDEFNINILDLRNPNIWCNKGNSIGNINCINDFNSISTMLSNSIKSTNVIIYPKNGSFEYDSYSGKYTKRIELKDMIPALETSLLGKLHPILGSSSIQYENTKTKAELNKIDASFYLENADNVLTYSIGSCKPTTLDFRKEHNLILTTLNLDTYESVTSFLKEINLIEIKEEVPEWMNQYKMFDDEKQLNLIQENNDNIKKSQENIDKALNVIKENERYKSILYTNGDELVEVVFEILEKMLGSNLSDFNDKKKEDFAMEIDGIHYIGEIKGVNHNVKSANISQLDVHYQSYIEENEIEDQGNVKALLIINHQRNKALESREDVHDQQIKLAERNGSLIIETNTLLKLFEKFKFEEVVSEKCIEILSQNTGLLTLEN